MFGVLIESKATAQRRAGGALLSVVAHTVVLSLAVVLTAQGSPGPIVDPVRKDPPVVTFVPIDPAPPRKSTSNSVSTGAAPCDCVVPPLPHKITIDGSIPPTNVDVLNQGPPVPDGRSLWGKAQPLGGPSLGSTEPTAESWSTSETSARLVHSARPRYPEMLRAAGVEGRVLVRFAIDTTGRVDAASITIVQSTHELFSRAVRDVMQSLRLLPAEVNGRRVPMLAEMAFEFALDRR